MPYSISNTITGLNNNTSWGNGSKKGELGATADILKNSTIPALRNITTARALQEYLRDQAGYTDLQVDERVGDQTLAALNDWIAYNKKNNPNNIDGVRIHSIDENPTLQFTSGTTNIGNPIDVSKQQIETQKLNPFSIGTVSPTIRNYNRGNIRYYRNQANGYRNVDEYYNWLNDNRDQDDYKLWSNLNMLDESGNINRKLFNQIMNKYGISGNLGRRDSGRLANVLNLLKEIGTKENNQRTNYLSSLKQNAINSYFGDNKGDLGILLTKLGYNGENSDNARLNWALQNSDLVLKELGFLKNGGKLNKFQQGGELNEVQQQFLNYLMQKYLIKDSKELDALVKQLASAPGEAGGTKLEDEQQEFMQQMQQTQTMKNGAKINYLRKLKGLCPEGYETTYYKVGGQICSKCAKKKAEKAQEGEKVSYFEKCGGKVKKKCGGAKFEEGGKTPKTKPQPKPQPKPQTKKLGDHPLPNDKGNQYKDPKTGKVTKYEFDKCGSKLTKKHLNGGTIFFN